MLSKSHLRSVAAAMALTFPLIGAGIFHAGDAAAQTKKKCTQAVKSSCSKTVKASCSTKVSAKGCSASCKGACSGEKACCKSAAAKMQAKRIAAVKAVASDLPYNESKRLVLTGHYICGKCQLEKFESCQALFKTSDGEIYPLVSNSKVQKLRTMKSSDSFQITTRVKRLDGIKYLEVLNFKEI